MVAIKIVCVVLAITSIHASEILFNDFEINLDLEMLIIALMNGLSYHGDIKCFTIICDTIYLNVFEGALFKRIIITPYIMIVVDEYEDLLSPNFDTLQSIRQARRDGCNAYVILLANGLQTSRLMKFGDKYRVIDTRAKYITLHDFRLFGSELHYIWKRIVNIVFIRHHGKVVGGRKTDSWFDLTTVPFPTPIQNVLVPKRLDTWKKGKFYKNNALFEDKTRNLNGQVLNVVYLEQIPAVTFMASGMNGTIGGVEIEILKTLAKIMNFEPHLYEPMNAKLHRWGHKQINGSFSGLLGEMVRGKADVALGNLQYTPYHLELTDLTIPYISQCLTFLTPEALTDNSWKTLILPFKLSMWIAVLMVLFITGTIFYGLANYHINLIDHFNKSQEPTKIDKLNLFNHQEQAIVTEKYVQSVVKPEGLYLFSEIINSILYTYGMLLVVSLPKLPTGWSVRLLTGWYWLYCILLVVSYRASMTAILANPAPRVTINTLTELVDSKITCGGWGTETKKFFENSLDETTQIIGKRFEVTNDPDEAVNKIAKGIYAYYDNEYHLKYISVKRQNLIINNKDIDANNSTSNNTEITPDSEERNLHIMTDCVVNIPISLGLQKNSPLKPRADEYLQRIIEVGLVEKWLNDAMQQIRTAEIANDDEVKALMNLKKLYGAFVALGIGYVLSFMCLIAELIQWHCVTRKDPQFDKYAMDLYYQKKKLQKINS